MKWAAMTFLVLVAVFGATDQWLGYYPTYKIGYGALALMGVIIGVTFLWLWHVRATPLALGMAFSWIGASLVMGWWWVYNLAGSPDAMTQSRMLFVFLALYIAGAFQHFGVIQVTMGLPSYMRFVPPAAAVVLAVLMASVS